MDQKAATVLEWTVWPARQRPILSIIVAVFALALSAGAMWSFGSGWYAFITLAVLALALADHYFPTRYRLGEQGVRRSGAGQVAEYQWEQFKSGLALPDRLILSRSRRRRVVVRLNGDRDAIIALVAAHVPLERVP